jgi:hypothetical protein
MEKKHFHLIPVVDNSAKSSVMHEHGFSVCIIVFDTHPLLDTVEDFSQFV